MSKKIHQDLHADLFQMAQEMTGEVRDTRFKSWAKRITSVDVNKSNGYSLEGEWVNPGTVELEDAPHIFLVTFRHGSRNYNVGEYAIVKMIAGELETTDIMTDDGTGGWALRIRDQVAALLDELSEDVPVNPLAEFSTDDLLAELERRGE